MNESRGNGHPDRSHVERIAREIVDAAVWLHRRTGPGMLESVYAALLAQELERRGFHVQREKPVRFEIDGITFTDGVRPDMIVDHLVVVELKSVERLNEVFFRQVLTYLRALKLPLGMLLNFGNVTLKKGGIHRIANDYWPDSDGTKP